MSFCLKLTGQRDVVHRNEDGDEIDCEVIDDVLVEGIGNLDEACRLLLDHKHLQRYGRGGFAEVNVRDADGCTVAWLDENGGLVHG